MPWVGDWLQKDTRKLSIKWLDSVSRTVVCQNLSYTSQISCTCTEGYVCKAIHCKKYKLKLHFIECSVCVCVCVCICLVIQSCPILCDRMDCRRPGFSVHRILQARMLEWVAMPFSKGYSQSRDQTQVSRIYIKVPRYLRRKTEFLSSSYEDSSARSMVLNSTCIKLYEPGGIVETCSPVGLPNLHGFFRLAW